MSAGLVGAVLAAGALAACGSSSSGSDGSTVKLGYFPNLTHATALVGLEQGTFTNALGSSVKLETRTYNAGPAALEALFSGAVDATYIGPSPTITGWSQSKGNGLKVVAGAASGGAALVVKPSITGPADLRGKKLGTPQLGNTQDVALRFWLKEKGFTTTKEGSGDVSVLPQDNAQILDAFIGNRLDGAWVPEPWVTRLVQAGGKVLVDERTLWPAGNFVTTQLIVRSEFLRDHPDLVAKLVQGSVAANASINGDPARAQNDVSVAIGRLTGKPLDKTVIADAWKNLTFTDDPLPATLRTGADHAVALGLTSQVDLNGLYDLGPLDAALQAAGKPTIAAP